MLRSIEGNLRSASRSRTRPADRIVSRCVAPASCWPSSPRPSRSRQRRHRDSRRAGTRGIGPSIGFGRVYRASADVWVMNAMIRMGLQPRRAREGDDLEDLRHERRPPAGGLGGREDAREWHQPEDSDKSEFFDLVAAGRSGFQVCDAVPRSLTPSARVIRCDRSPSRSSLPPSRARPCARRSLRR